MKHKLKKIFESAVWWSGVVMVGLVLGLTLQFVRAWTEPGEAPPGGNVGAPINTGPIGQLKQGVLGVAGLLTNAFQMPTGAQPGYVLTTDAQGIGSWQSGGGGGSVPSGAVMFFNLSSCPSGWSELTAARGRYPVGLPSGGTLAGTKGTALSNLENRVAPCNHTHYESWYTDCMYWPGNRWLFMTYTIPDPGTAGTNAPYIQLLACQKN